MLSDLLDTQLDSPVEPAIAEKTSGPKPLEKKHWHLPKFTFDRSKIRKFFSKETILRLEEEGKVVLSLLSFFGLLMLFLGEMFLKALGRVKVLKGAIESTEKFWSSRMGKMSEKIIDRLESREGGVRRSFLIALAFRNMKAKKTRSFVTVGGMGVGIAAIVFLVSVGYGLQNLVVSRVARLEELKMADVTLGQSANIRIDNAAVQSIENIPNVAKVLPVVSLVGKVSFGGGVSESVVHGVTGDYLAGAGLNKVKGEYFETEAKTALLPDIRVAGATTVWQSENARVGARIRNVVFNIEPETYLRVRAEPNTKSEIIGYVRRVEGGYEGVEYWGEGYAGSDRGREGKDGEGNELGRWIKAPYPIWDKKGIDDYEPLYDSERIQEWREGYVAELDLLVDEDASSYVAWEDATDRTPNVLGEATESAQVATASASQIASDLPSPEATITATIVGTDEQGVEWVTLGDEASGAGAIAEVMIVDLPESAQRQAVVNRAFLELLGVDINDAVGSTFEIAFVILNTLKPDLDRPAESSLAKYVVQAVIEEGNAPIIYVPLGDITSLGISNYSQAKLIVKDKSDLAKVRQQVDNLGYKTASVADTVAQIDKLFGTARAVLATFGMVALAVASLGMFNTLTVSLMERTREVGVMKAMGMQSSEVKELFLAEAMVMGILGGIFGVLAGWIAGKMLGVILSAFAVIKGVGYVDVSYIPPLFVIFVLVLSFVVGVVTGIYPARRATKISALDALRYE